MRERRILRERGREPARRARIEQVRHGRVPKEARRVQAFVQPVAVHRHDAERRLGGEELREVLQPRVASTRGAGQREPADRSAKARELVCERLEVVARGPPGHRDAPRGVVVAPDRVKLGFIAKFKRCYVPLADPGEERARLGRFDHAIVGLEVDPHDVAQAGFLGQCARDREPAWRDVIRNSPGAPHLRDRPPGPVGAVASDTHLRSLIGSEILEQPYEHGIDRVRVGSRIGEKRSVLERKPDESGGDRRPVCDRADRHDRRRGWRGCRRLRRHRRCGAIEQECEHDHRNGHRGPAARRVSPRTATVATSAQQHKRSVAAHVGGGALEPTAAGGGDSPDTTAVEAEVAGFPSPTALLAVSSTRIV